MQKSVYYDQHAYQVKAKIIKVTYEDSQVVSIFVNYISLPCWVVRMVCITLKA